MFESWLAKKAQRPEILVLVRHGKSLSNEIKGRNIYLPDGEVAELLQDIPDQEIPLVEEGIKQAREAGILIREKFGIFDIVYHSNYLRTIQTQEEILRAYNKKEIAKMKLRDDATLRERDPGYHYFMTAEEVDSLFPKYRAYWKAFGYFYARPPGGESQADVCDRVHRFIGEHLFRIRVGKKVLIVTHGGTIRAFRYNLEKWDANRYEKEAKTPLPNCGLIIYKFNPKTKRLELENK